MSIRMYHQVGHYSNWNLESFAESSCGDGLILSPVHQQREKVESLPSSIRTRSLFDPQFYLPNSQKKKLNTYSFFPEQISNGFSTNDFALVALESANQCVAFQIQCEFESIIIPARFISGVASKFLEEQTEYTLIPFLKALSKATVEKPIFLTLPLTSAMLVDADFRTRLLNWATGYPEVSGVYVVVNDDRKTKQIQNSGFISSYLEFLAELSGVGLKVVASHLNTEGLLFSLVDDAIITFGSFENTRMFSIDKFLESDEERRAPQARIYLPKLLNWIQFGHAVELRNDAPELWEKIYTPTEYSEAVFESGREPYFTQSPLYKHYFKCFYGQIQQLAVMPPVARFQILKRWIEEAMTAHQEVAGLPLDLDTHGNGKHLQPWLDSLNSFYRRYLKS